MPAVMATWWPKLRDRWTTLNRGSSRWIDFIITRFFDLFYAFPVSDATNSIRRGFLYRARRRTHASTTSASPSSPLQQAGQAGMEVGKRRLLVVHGNDDGVPRMAH